MKAADESDAPRRDRPAEAAHRNQHDGDQNAGQNSPVPSVGKDETEDDRGQPVQHDARADEPSDPPELIHCVPLESVAVRGRRYLKYLAPTFWNAGKAPSTTSRSHAVGHAEVALRPEAAARHHQDEVLLHLTAEGDVVLDGRLGEQVERSLGLDDLETGLGEPVDRACRG